MELKDRRHTRQGVLHNKPPKQTYIFIQGKGVPSKVVITTLVRNEL